MVMLANASHHDMWINVPVDADDDYVRLLVSLVTRTAGGAESNDPLGRGLPTSRFPKP
jgi:hypothetical protein